MSKTRMPEVPIERAERDCGSPAGAQARDCVLPAQLLRPFGAAARCNAVANSRWNPRLGQPSAKNRAASQRVRSKPRRKTAAVCCAQSTEC